MTHSKPLIPILRRGAILGALTGLGVSAVYAGLLIAFFLLMVLYGAISSASTNPSDAAMMLLVGPASAGFMLLCAGFIGVLPGTILGLVIGLLISLPLALLHPHLSNGGAAVVGAVVSAGVVILIHIFLIRSDPNPTVQEYLFLTILPSPLCIAAGGWVGWKLHRSIEK